MRDLARLNTPWSAATKKALARSAVTSLDVCGRHFKLAQSCRGCSLYKGLCFWIAGTASSHWKCRRCSACAAVSPDFSMLRFGSSWNGIRSRSSIARPVSERCCHLIGRQHSPPPPVPWPDLCYPLVCVQQKLAAGWSSNLPFSHRTSTHTMSLRRASRMRRHFTSSCMQTSQPHSSPTAQHLDPTSPLATLRAQMYRVLMTGLQTGPAIKTSSLHTPWRMTSRSPSRP